MSKAKEILSQLKNEASAALKQKGRVLKKLEGGHWESGGKKGSFKVSDDTITWNNLTFDLESVKAVVSELTKSMADVGQTVRLSDGSTNVLFKRISK